MCLSPETSVAKWKRKPIFTGLFKIKKFHPVCIIYFAELAAVCCQYLDNSPLEQFAPDNLPPIFKQLAPHSFIHYQAKPAAKYMNLRLTYSVIQIILHSFIHYQTIYSSFFYPLLNKLFFVLLSTTESEDQGRVVWGELSRGRVVRHLCCLHLSTCEGCRSMLETEMISFQRRKWWMWISYHEYMIIFLHILICLWNRFFH